MQLIDDFEKVLNIRAVFRKNLFFKVVCSI